jgi:predicted PurR-regulated permease PerM
MWLGRLWARWRVENKRHHQELANEMYHTVTGYVTGNILTSVVASIAAWIAMLVVGVPYSAPLAITVGVVDLIPLVGATLSSIIVITVALFQSLTAAIIMLIYFIVYQLLENHILQPLIYGKTVQISPLLVLISVLIGAGLGGLLGALVAIPVAASVQILVKDYLKTRRSPL